MQRRDDAAKAMEAMDGVILHDFELRIGWGKAMALPPVPVWPGPNAGGAAPSSAPANAHTGFSLAPGLPPVILPVPVGGAGSLAWSTGVERRLQERGMHDVSRKSMLAEAASCCQHVRGRSRPCLGSSLARNPWAQSSTISPSRLLTNQPTMQQPSALAGRGP